MKVYSDKLDAGCLYSAAGGILGLSDVTPIIRPRVRKYGWKVVTCGNGGRWKNTGKHGASSEMAATWDDHGRWMARLFILDPRAVVGPYRGVEDFHAKTANRYTAESVKARLASPAASSGAGR